ncbi:MAG: pseudouridine-5'-phosphate glycosidase [Actinomycetota bacterium]
MITPRRSSEVAAAQRAGQPIVALESTIFSNLGLPSPDNAVALERCVAAVRNAGAVPAVTAVLDGDVRLGLADEEYPRILGEARKMAERDVPVAVSQGWSVGATTVSASLAIAAAGDVAVFATGGIGGVHRGLDSFDISADLDAIAHHRVVTVSAGAKAFLDLGKTLEYLETRGVPVLGWRHDDFPAFYARSSGFPVAHRVESAEEVAAILAAGTRPTGGVLLAVPIPEAAALDGAEIDAAISAALDAADADGVVGPAVTPYVLERIAHVTEGRSVPANLALAEHNASVAADIAVAVSQM